jgi:hypothetical protein
MAKIIFTTLIHLFPFERLTVTRLYQLIYYILETLHRIESKLAPSSDYARLKEEFEQYSEVHKRNPALLQTEELWNTHGRLLEAMKQLGSLVKMAVTYGTGARLTAAKQVEYIIKPYFTPSISHQAIADLLSNSGKMVVDLQTAATTPLVATLELTALVAEIDALAHAADAIYNERSDEKELRHLLGSATKRRTHLTDALETVLYSLLQALQSLAPTAADRAEIDEVINHINGLLDSYKIYVKDGGSSDSSGGIPDYPSDGDGDNDPDDGNGNNEDPEPPAGGNENPGGDSGSGGPLDRGGITININE